MASWTYDSASGGIGKLATSTRHDPHFGDFVTTIDAYDQRGRVVSHTDTVPSSLGPLAGDYTTTRTYNEE